ncbi:MAG: hypothetical protein ISS93_02205 [Candidatus Aenigmarchaeota archaeon]|nr:hypothetical protein [Candidatus Aenigmarchaeota archaeon]
MGAEISFETGATLISVLVVIVVIIVGMSLWATIFQTSCWKGTLSELNTITASSTGGIGKCLGREKFTIGLTLRSECLNRIEFTTFEGCEKVCNSAKLGENCLNACLKCKDHDGCILAVPKPEGEFFPKMWEALKRFQSGFSPITTYPTMKYSFTGQTSYPGPKKGAPVMCIDFSIPKGGMEYSIKSKSVSSIEKCEVSECKPFE